MGAYTMDVQEFKAWFAGYTEDMIAPPTPKQWERIKEAISSLTNSPVFPPNITKWDIGWGPTGPYLTGNPPLMGSTNKLDVGSPGRAADTGKIGFQGQDNA